MRDFRISVPPLVYFVLFAVSGFAGLIYESIWTHYLKLFLGHAAYAQTLVLAIFMGGLALGSWVAGAYSVRLRNLLLGYAIVEGLIGVAALAFHVLFVHVTGYTYDTLLPAISSPVLAQAVKWTLGGLFILPQSVLLGMTFPLMSGGVIRRHPQAPGRTLASLYFSNSLGATVGVLASGFVLIRVVGLPGTLLTAGLLNLLLALLVWLIVRASEDPASAPVPVQPARGWAGDRWVKLMLLGAGVTGAASFLYEIAWIRMLSLVLGSATHSFELMLAAFILGLALGGLYVRRRIERLANPVRFLAYAQLLMGGFALATLPVYGQSFEWMSFLVHALAQTTQGYVLFLVASSLIALAVMLPATILAGTTLPLFTFVLLNRGQGERAIGSVYAANTVGAIIGVLVAVHLLMPVIGVKGVVVVGAVADLALGVMLLTLALPPARRAEAYAGAGAALAGVLVVTLTVHLDPLRLLSSVYRDGVARKSDTIQVAFLRDGKTATVGLVRDSQGGVSISTNGKPDAAISPMTEAPSPDEATMVLAGALALSHHPGAKVAANIGFGSGLTTHTMLSTQQLERLDTVEIEPYMVEAARGFGERVRFAYEDPRSRIYIEDAKTFFSTVGTRYDIIVSEPSNPWVSGVASLFSAEFYSRIRKHLAPGGLLVQWVQGYEIDLPLFASVLKAMDPYFSDYAIYTSNGVDLLIVACRDGVLPVPDEGVLRDPGLAKELARVQVQGTQDLAVRRLVGRPLMRALLATYGVPANSDYFPFLDQNAARTRFLQSKAIEEINPLWIDGLPVVEMLEGRSLDERQVTRSKYFLPAALAHDAWLAHDAILGRGEWGARSETLRGEWALATFMLDRCDPRADWAQWRATVRAFAARTTPFLAPREAVQMIDRLHSSRCLGRLPAVNAKWVDLLRAVAARDPLHMSDAASDLLEDNSNEAVAYLVHAAMVAALARDHAQEALAVWQKHGAKLGDARAVPLDTRLLVSVAQSEAITQQAKASSK